MRMFVPKMRPLTVKGERNETGSKPILTNDVSARLLFQSQVFDPKLQPGYIKRPDSKHLRSIKLDIEMQASLNE